MLNRFLQTDSAPLLVPRTSRTFLNVDYPEDDSDEEYDPEKDQDQEEADEVKKIANCLIFAPASICFTLL